MRSQILRIVALAWLLLGFWLSGLALAQLFAAKPAVTTSIVLHYRETPVLLGPHEHNVSAIAFSPDGRYIVCGGHGKDIAVFDVAQRALHCELRGHGHPATSAAFLPGGRLLSGGDERTVRLWDLNPGQLLATWIAVPADEQQHWADEWVGFKPSGEFVGSMQLDRLVGWQSGGDFFSGAEGGDRRRRVESLFDADSSVPSARD